MRKLLFIIIALVLTACSVRSQTEIERNEQKWQNTNISHYRFHLVVGCFCVFSQNMPLVIEVQNNEVVSMEYKSGNEIDASSCQIFEKYGTIDRIFSELKKDINGEADEVTVTYDATRGFPSEAKIDFIKNAIDDELYLTLSNFEALP